MLQFEEKRMELCGMRSEITDLAQALNLEGLTSKIDQLEEQVSSEGFWNDPSVSQSVLRQIKFLKGKRESYQRLVCDYENLLELIDIAILENEESLYEDICQSANQIEKELQSQRLSTLLTGEYDAKNALLAFHAGAGGTEAQDWALMLYRMYCRWADRNGFKVKVMDMLDGEEAGIKSAYLLIEGTNAYGFLKSEAGIHRLVRISPFDASGRRHTSFASLEVMPEIDDEIKIDIRDEDLRVDTYRSGGAGGQHVNKTESAIRITHIPSGVVVACQNERSQHQNREVAMKMLKSKLIEIKEREHLDKVEDIKGEQREIAWGSQIRSYVFMPYTLVKDHRTSFENGNISAVMDGDIDGFINAYLKMKSLEKLNG